MEVERLFRVSFLNRDKVYEVYCRDVYQGDLYGFIVLEELVFDEHTTLVVDPSEERLKHEFDGVRQTIIPMHSVFRIDEVEKRGTAKVTELAQGGNVTPFRSPIYTPSGDKN